MEEIIVSGSEETVKPIITMLMGISQMLNNRDIGQFVGEPLEENIKAVPSLLTMKIVWYSAKEPPFQAPVGKRFIKAECNIPDVYKSKLKWETIKQLAGGANGYEWGEYLALAKLDNNRQMHVRGATKAIASKQLDNMLELTKAKVTSISVIQLTKAGRRASGQTLEIKPARIYPANFIIVNSKKIDATQQRIYRDEIATRKLSTLRGDYAKRGSQRIPLWTDKPPKDYKQILNNAFNIDVV
ncbi:hypothetical protein [Calothrix sp. PCC 6303]|uniref:hypothetical protein n=1 Tax=Calothrix sp. PCC 6303 TaxID=1170562 RepID=UPI0002A01BAE|nr:hypothetical protein [Calothrix sp. PCC 6303]AFZ01636.1 hypothetical protein Cal6303_2663 [Calothrix sp. PCC 6303]